MTSLKDLLAAPVPTSMRASCTDAPVITRSNRCSKHLPALCERASAELVYRPTLLGGVFQATGNVSPAAVPAKGRYMDGDMARFARMYNVPLAVNPHFPINTLTLTERDGRTTATITVLYPSKDARDAALKTGMKEGAGQSYDRLEKLLGTMHGQGR